MIFNKKKKILISSSALGVVALISTPIAIAFALQKDKTWVDSLEWKADKSTVVANIHWPNDMKMSHDALKDGNYSRIVASEMHVKQFNILLETITKIAEFIVTNPETKKIANIESIELIVNYNQNQQTKLLIGPGTNINHADILNVAHLKYKGDDPIPTNLGMAKKEVVAYYILSHLKAYKAFDDPSKLTTDFETELTKIYKNTYGVK